MSIARSMNYMITKDQLDKYVTTSEVDEVFTVEIDSDLFVHSLRSISGERNYILSQVAKVYGLDTTKPHTVTTSQDNLYGTVTIFAQAMKDTIGRSNPPALRCCARGTNIIGFVGHKRSGKDTAAFALMQSGYEIVKFAAPLKSMMRAFLTYVRVAPDLQDALIEGDAKELTLAPLCGKSARHAMQTLGTEWGRQLIGDSIWVEACLAHCKQFDKVVVADVRFANEAAALRQIGATIVRITRPATADEVDTHASERELNGIIADFTLVNNGTTQDLQDKVLALLK